MNWCKNTIWNNFRKIKLHFERTQMFPTDLNENMFYINLKRFLVGKTTRGVIVFVLKLKPANNYFSDLNEIRKVGVLKHATFTIYHHDSRWYFKFILKHKKGKTPPAGMFPNNMHVTQLSYYTEFKYCVVSIIWTETLYQDIAVAGSQHSVFCTIRSSLASISRKLAVEKIISVRLFLRKFTLCKLMLYLQIFNEFSTEKG